MPATTYPDAPFSSTVKDRRGDLHTFRGLNYDEWYENGSKMIGEPQMDKILAEIEERVAAEAPAPSSQPQGNSGGSGGGGGAATGGWADNAPVCSHGTMRAQSYKAKSGPKVGQDQYTFFCPQPKEAPASEKCSPVDGITRKPWGTK